MTAIDKLVVIGVGLIGGSFALTLKQAQAVKRVVGVGRSRGNLQRALALGVVDEVQDDPGDAVADADLILLAVPSGQCPTVLAAIADRVDSHTVVTDACSTKGDVCRYAREHFSRRLSRFVPGHPIAGTEQSGAAAAKVELFRGKRVVLTPLAETEPLALERVRAAWQACGARVVEMSAQTHDRTFAAVSHLPHALAFAFVDMIARHPERERLFANAGSGFRDSTRLASASVEMWRDICLANRDALLSELDGYQRALQSLRGALEARDASALAALFARARAAREGWLAEQPPAYD